MPAMTTDRREALQAGRAAKTAARRASSLRRDFLDAPRWDELAQQFGVRLPPYGEPLTGRLQETFLHRIGKSLRWYTDLTNERKGEFAERNPTWPARAWAGIVLEMLSRGS